MNNKFKSYLDKFKISNNSQLETNRNFSYKRVIYITDIVLAVISFIILASIYKKVDINIFIYIFLGLIVTAFMIVVVGKIISAIVINILKRIK